MIDINAFEPQTLILLALLNPVTIAVAVLMGRKADQWQKIPVAAFAAACAGFLAYYVATFAGLFRVHALGGEAALLAMQFTFGLLWAGLGYACAVRCRA